MVDLDKEAGHGGGVHGLLLPFSGDSSLAPFTF